MYRNWSEEDFKAKMPINRTTFNFILDGIYEDIILTPTNLKPNPTSPDRQLALTIYRLATGCTYSTLSDLFGVSVSAASKLFNKICRKVLCGKRWPSFVKLFSMFINLNSRSFNSSSKAILICSNNSLFEDFLRANCCKIFCWVC